MLDLKELQEALDTSDKIIKEYDDKYIYGKYGKVFAVTEYWYAYIGVNWVKAKTKLPFMTISQDGDSDGILKMDRYPTKSEAAQIRKILGLSKKKHLSEEHKKKLVEAGRKFTLKHESTTPL